MTTKTKPQINALLKELGLNPKSLNIFKNGWWTVKAKKDSVFEAQWPKIHVQIVEGLKSRGVRFQSYGFAVQIFL